MKQSLPQWLLVIVLWSLVSACSTPSDLVPLLASDDCGPKPANYREIAAAWFNTHCRFTPPNPIKPDELSMSEPTRAAAFDRMLGRQAGWEVILGPENKTVMNFTDMKFTRLIINEGRVVLVTSSNHPFQ